MVIGAIILPSFARHVLLVAQLAMVLDLLHATPVRMFRERFTIYNGDQIYAT